MNTGEYLYPLPSVNAFVSENLNVYRMEKDGKPNINLTSTIAMLASNWVNIISKEDDMFLSELIYYSKKN